MKTRITMRVVRNKRLHQTAYLWTLPLLIHSPSVRTYDDRRRARGDSYSAAARNLGNRRLGMLYPACNPSSSTTNQGLPDTAGSIVGHMRCLRALTAASGPQAEDVAFPARGSRLVRHGP